MCGDSGFGQRRLQFKRLGSKKEDGAGEHSIVFAACICVAVCYGLVIELNSSQRAMFKIHVIKNGAH